MKNLFKLLFAGIVLAGLGTNAFAQSSSSTTASVTATLLTNVAIVKNTDVTFAQVASGTVPTLDASTGVISNAGTGAHLGKLTVTATGGSSVKLSYDAAVDMVGPGSTKLTFTPSLYRTALTNDTYGATSVGNPQVYTVNSSSSSAVAGTDMLFVGGTLGAYGTSSAIPALDTNLVTGSYTGTFHITATYN